MKKKLLRSVLAVFAAGIISAAALPVFPVSAEEPITDAYLIEQSVRNYAKEHNIPIYSKVIDTIPAFVEVNAVKPDAETLRAYGEAQNFSPDILKIGGNEFGCMSLFGVSHGLEYDNQPTVMDAQYILCAATEILTDNRKPMEGLEKRIADVNLDGSVDTADAQLVLLFYVQNTLADTQTTWEELLSQNYNAVNLTETAETIEIKSQVADDKFTASQLDLTANLLKESLALHEYANKNTMISPLSISQALAMTANGAVGQTQDEMTKVLGGDLSMDDLNAFYYWYSSNLKNDENASLKQANSIWVRDDENRVQVPDAFLQIAKSNYNAQVFRAQFDESTVTDINNWVNFHTDEMIPTLLDKIEPDHIMFLINALAFDGKWAVPYAEKAVREGEFHTADGKTVTTDFMHSAEGIYIHDESTAGFIKYYAGRNYSFAAVLPNEDIKLTDYVKNMTGTTVKNLLNSSTGDDVEAAMPKFTFDYDIQLKEPLKKMGMPTAFIYGEADFTKLNAVPGTFIDFVLHKTHIEVDETGTKAAAATVVGMADECKREQRTVTLDRPFLFMILDNNSRLPVFIGCVYDPTAQ